MSQTNNADNNDSFKLDAGLIVNFLMLFIPGLRFFGAIWLYRRFKRQYRGKKSSSAWTLIPTVLFAIYALSEIGAGGYLWPLSVVAMVAVAISMIARSFSNKSDDVFAFLHGRDACYVSTLANALNMSDAQVMTCVRQLKRKGKLPQTTYIDKARGLIVLTPNGRPAEDEVRQRSA